VGEEEGPRNGALQCTATPGNSANKKKEGSPGRSRVLELFQRICVHLQVKSVFYLEGPCDFRGPVIFRQLLFSAF
jgi:hypothetical protein